MNFHYQDLNNEPKKYISHGRFWLDHGAFLHAEWSVPARQSTALTLDLNTYGDTAIGIHLALWLFSIHISTENRKIYKFLERITKRPDQTYTNGRSIGVRFFDNAMWISLWEDPMESRSVDPKWWRFTIHFDDIFLGKTKYTKDIEKVGECSITMPEGEYPASYEVATQIWKRPLWFAVKKRSIYFSLPVSIPEEGKGENSWDMGMDGTSGVGTYYNDDLWAATKRVALNLLASRQRYGSLHSDDYAFWRTEGLLRMGLPVDWKFNEP